LRLSTRSRYGTRLMLDMVQHCKDGAVQLNDIAKRQDISVKYLEQIVIPLKKAKYITSVRGAKGGYLLAKSPKEVTVGEIVALMGGGEVICPCAEHPDTCDKVDTCLIRNVWIDAAKAMYEKLNSITLSDIIKKADKIVV